VWLLLAWPARANAWWGWIDELTGPRGFHGPQFDARIWCFPVNEEDGVTTTTVGARLSLCTPKDERHRAFSIDFGSRLFYATDNSPELEGASEAYANGHRMYLFTAVPMLEFRPFHSNDTTRFDYIDLAAGGGYYRVSSDGFKPLQGTVIEARATIRTPVRFRQSHAWAVAVPQFSFGPIGFVDGFKANAFGPHLQGQKALAKHDGAIDWTWQYAFFFELLPAAR
jgi:hypothetical protein